ncbi:MAG: hypothetical protein IRY94_14135 [Rhodospirillaceae bacterium]|nr:hypothetical protein [Rhodospirillaceae bacterium]
MRTFLVLADTGKREGATIIPLYWSRSLQRYVARMQDTIEEGTETRAA